MIKQHGATLAVVLLLVLAIALIGGYSVRNSMSVLQFSTHRQIQALLFQNSDAALFQIEDPSILSQQLVQGGILDYFDSALNTQDELVLCYRATQVNFLLITQASAISPNGNTGKRADHGFCKANDYAIGRAAVLTQLYVSQNIDQSAPQRDSIQKEGLDPSTPPMAKQQIRVSVISILPSFSSINAAQIEQCFKQKSSMAAPCFAGFNVPFNVMHASYMVESQANLKPE